MTVRTALRNALWSFLSARAPRDIAAEELRKTITVNLMLFFSGLYCLLLGVVAYRQGDYILGIADHSMMSVITTLALVLRYRSALRQVGIIATAISGAFFVFLFAHGGVSQSASVWVFPFPLIAVFVVGGRAGSYITLFFFAAVSGVFVLGHTSSLVAQYSVQFGIRMSAAYMLIYFFTVVLEHTRLVYYSRLNAVNRKTSEYADQLVTAGEERQALVTELESALAQVRTLQGFLPICSECKKIRDDEGYWKEVELYISEHTDSVFSHGICPDCAHELYGEYFDDVRQRQRDTGPLQV